MAVVLEFLEWPSLSGFPGGCRFFPDVFFFRRCVVGRNSVCCQHNGDAALALQHVPSRGPYIVVVTSTLFFNSSIICRQSETWIVSGDPSSHASYAVVAHP